MIGLKRACVAAAGVSLLVAVVTAVNPGTGFGQGRGNGQAPQDVVVVNGVSAPVPVVGTVQSFEAAKVPYESRIDLTFQAGETLASGQFDSVPPGKQLIVTFASGHVNPSAVSGGFRILKSNFGTVAVHHLKPVDTGTIEGIVGAEPLHMVVNSNESLTGTISRDLASASTLNGNNGMSISGYLVDVP